MITHKATVAVDVVAKSVFGDIEGIVVMIAES